MSRELTTVTDIEKMAKSMVSSKLFGMKTVEEAMALMFIAQAEGSHPAIAIRDYHVIQGKPALKADAMMSRFQAAGGKVKWTALSDERVAADFSHPQGGTASIDWDMARAKRAQLGGNGMWGKYPRQMLRARVISEGIRTVFPGVIVGSYTEEEVHDFNTIEGTATPVPTPPEVPSISMALSREQMEQIYDEALAKINGASDIDALAKSWAPYARTIKTLDEDLMIDLIQKKDECKEELSRNSISGKLENAERLVNA